MSGPHSAEHGGRKSSASQGTAQVVVGIAVGARKVRTAEAEERFDFGGRRAPREQLPGDPQIHNAPVGLGKAFGNPQSLHPDAIGFRCLGSHFDRCWYTWGAAAALRCPAELCRRRRLPGGFERKRLSNHTLFTRHRQ
jgi:hypothetical protein